MKFNLSILLALFVLFTSNSFAEKVAEKKKFTLDDAMKFKSIQGMKISDDAKWIVYSLQPDRGDATTYVQSVDDVSKQYQIPRAESSQLSLNSTFMAFSIKGKAIEIENAKTDKDKPKSSLSILNLQNGEINNIENVKSFTISNNGNWIAYKFHTESKTDKDSKNKKSLGEETILRHLQSKTDIKLESVLDFAFDSLSNKFFYVVSSENAKKDGLYYRDLSKAFAPEQIIFQDSASMISNLSWNIDKEILAYTHAKLDSVGKALDCNLRIWKSNSNENLILMKDSSLKDMFIPNKNKLSWSENGNLLYFGIKAYWEKVADKDDKFKFKDENFYDKDKITQKAQLYLWHSKDELIIPNQKVLWKDAKDQTYFSYYDLNQNKVFNYSNLPSSDLIYNQNSNNAVLLDKMSYLKEVTYSGSFSDIKLINLQNKENKIISKHVSEGAYLSPNGNFIVFYDNKNWNLYDIKNSKLTNLTSSISTAFYDLENDVPKDAPSCGFAAWGENDEFVMIYDNYDIWKFSTSNFTSENLTKSINRTSNIKFKIQNLQSDKLFFKLTDTLLLDAFDKKSKEDGIISFNLANKTIINSISGKKAYNIRLKSKLNNAYLFTKESFDEFPDFWITDNTLSSPKKLTDANPEMKNFLWGNSELLSWKSPSGDSLQGYIIKPENYDSKKKYPVVIYFYEQMSDETYKFSLPMVNHRPCFQQYLSDGYCIFLPDIKYTTGYPGKSSLDALLSGSRYISKIGIADSNKIGLWGHSWSGYQGAYIITQTDFYKACVAGAPVGNMTSAYSGIRLGSGLARQFQYEKEQSRIGGTFKDSLQRYIENSPVFYAQNAKTPLLIFFGDVDDAVPYSQGIELYLAFRRWDKDCIMLQYEDEPHHPKKYWNKMDYAIKMKEFYDYHLLGKDAPKWIKEGIKYRGDYTR